MPMDTTHIISFFFFNDTATTEIYTLSLHDALPILSRGALHEVRAPEPHERRAFDHEDHIRQRGKVRSEEHTSELQSQSNLVCRLLLEKKKMSHFQPSACVPTFSLIVHTSYVLHLFL